MICEYEGRYYGDTQSIQDAGRLGVLDHMGFGDFQVSTPGGTVYWHRCPTPWEGIREGWSGRTHVLSGSGLDWLRREVAGRAERDRLRDERDTQLNEERD